MVTTAVEEARATLAQLNEKLAASDRRAIELGERGDRRLSLAAMTGDAAAAKAA